MDVSMYLQPCSAKSKTTGVRCRRTAILGGTLCYYHGGAAPQVKRAAKERLMELLLPAIDRLEKLMEQTELPSVALSAVISILDRNGLVPEHKLKHSGQLTTGSNDDLPGDVVSLVASLNEILAGPAGTIK